MAAGSGGLRAGKAFIELFLKDSGVEGQLGGIQKKMLSIGGGMQKVGGIATAVGGTITGAFAGALAVFNETGSKLADMSGQTGISVEKLSQLGYAAGQSGGSLDAVGAAATKMNNFLLAAGRGSKGAQTTLADLGLTLDDLAGKSPDEQFKLFADKLSQIEDPGKRAALAVKVFGGAGKELLPMLSGGAAGIEALQAQSDALGVTMSTQAATAADNFGDSLGVLWEQVKALTVSVAAAIAGPLTGMLTAIQPIIASVIEWAKQQLKRWPIARKRAARTGRLLTGPDSANVCLDSLLRAARSSIVPGGTKLPRGNFLGDRRASRYDRLLSR